MVSSDIQADITALLIYFLALSVCNSIGFSPQSTGFVSPILTRTDNNSLFRLPIVYYKSDSDIVLNTKCLETLPDLLTDDGRHFTSKLSRMVLNNGSFQHFLEEFCTDIISSGSHAFIHFAKDLLYSQFIVHFAEQYRIPIIGVDDGGISNLIKKTTEPWYINLGANEHDKSLALVALIQALKWRYISIIACNDSIHELQADTFTSAVTASNLKVLSSIYIETDPLKYDDLEAKLYVLKSSGSRIITVYCSKEHTKVVFKYARKYDLLSPDHVWILTQDIILGPNSSAGPISTLPAGLLGVSQVYPDGIQLRTKQYCDAVNVFQLGIKQAIKYNILSPRSSLNCSIKPQIQNTNFFSTLRSVKFSGMTGMVEFDDEGNRIKPSYIIFNTQQRSTTTTEWKEIAQYTNGEITLEKRIYWPSGRPDKPLDSSGLPRIRVVTIPQEPFGLFSELYDRGLSKCDTGILCNQYVPRLDFNKSDSNSLQYSTVTKCCEGLVIDILKKLQEDLDFDPDVYIVKDGAYGAYDEKTKTWNGMVADVMKGDADMAMAALTINSQRSEVIDFTVPYLSVGMSILVSVSKKSRPLIDMSFLDPFTMELWLCLVCICLAITVIMWALDRLSPYGHYHKARTKSARYLFGIQESLWYTLGLFLQHDFTESTRPRSASSRIVAMSFAFCMLIALGSYTANLAASLVRVEEQVPVTGIHDPKMMYPPSGFRISTITDSSVESFFKNSVFPDLNKIYANMAPHGQKNETVGVQKLKQGDISAWIGDEIFLHYIAEKQTDCSLRVVGQPFGVAGYGFALSKTSKWKEKINHALRMYQDLEDFVDISEKWLGAGTTCGSDDPWTSAKQFDISALNGVFFVIATCAGIGFAIIVGCIKYIHLYLSKSVQLKHQFENEFNERHRRPTFVYTNGGLELQDIASISSGSTNTFS